MGFGQLTCISKREGERRHYIDVSTPMKLKCFACGPSFLPNDWCVKASQVCSLLPRSPCMPAAESCTETEEKLSPGQPWRSDIKAKVFALYLRYIDTTLIRGSCCFRMKSLAQDSMMTKVLFISSKTYFFF